MRWRAATRWGRTLPDFFILSGGRCGSTSLFAILSAHRQVMPPSHKEVHFFDRNYQRGLGFYRRLFPLAIHRSVRARRLGAKVLTGEATTYYLLHPAVPSRVSAVLPDARLIVMLRDPVDRAYSHY
jgi:Sulfotransferase domain